MLLSRIVGIFVLGFLSIGLSHAQFGLPSLKSPSGDKASAGAMAPDEFIKQAQDADKLMKASRDYLFKGLASKDEVERIDRLQKAAEATTDPKEKDAKIAELGKEKDAVLKQVNFSQKAEQLKASKNSEQNKQIGNASFNFLLALLRDKELAGQSSSVISSATSNPAMMAKVPALKDVAASLTSQVGTASDLASKLPTLFSAVELKAAPTKASDAPMQLKGGD
jgi:hypothetical protein